MSQPVAEMDLVASVASDLIPHIPADKYLVRLDHFRTALMFGRQPKLILGLKVVEGEFMGTVIPKFYNVLKLKSKAGPRGKFVVGRHSDYLYDYARLHGLPDRLDRLSMQPWRECVLLGRVSTVTHGRGQRELPAAMRYSKVTEFLEKVAG